MLLQCIIVIIMWSWQVQFEDKTVVLLNRENFEWNHSAATKLNQCFREKTSAVDFIQEFNRVTTTAPHSLYRILKKDVLKEPSDDSETM